MGQFKRKNKTFECSVFYIKKFYVIIFSSLARNALHKRLQGRENESDADN